MLSHVGKLFYCFSVKQVMSIGYWLDIEIYAVLVRSYIVRRLERNINYEPERENIFLAYGTRICASTSGAGKSYTPM